jgi:hypothetical protein
MYKVPNVHSFIVGEPPNYDHRIHWAFLYDLPNGKIEAQLDLDNGEFLHCGDHDTRRLGFEAVVVKATELQLAAEALISQATDLASPPDPP